MTKEQAKAIAQQYTYLQVIAQPSKLASIGWEICCACRDGQTRYAFCENDLRLLAGSGLVRVK